MCGSADAPGQVSGVGAPSSLKMREIWSNSALPGNSVSLVSSSAMMQPTDHTSIGVLYLRTPAPAAAHPVYTCIIPGCVCYKGKLTIVTERARMGTLLMCGASCPYCLLADHLAHTHLFLITF